MYIFSGQLCVGKDHVAENAGLLPVSIAEPIYRIAEHYLGTSDKTRPEVRRFLQVTGMWGRGEKECVECEGVLLTQMTEDLQKNGAAITGMNMPWEEFSANRDFWLKGTVVRALSEVSSGKSIAVTNGRFENEIATLRAAGASYYHIMCDEGNRRIRMRREFNPKIDMEGTEKMAYALTQKVLQGGPSAIDATGVVWNDQKTPCPFAGALTLEEFIEIVRANNDKSINQLPGRIGNKGSAPLNPTLESYCA